MPYTIEIIQSDKDTHFTGALVQYAIENESLDFPTDFSTTQIQKLLIHQISIQSDQVLDWDVILWSDSGYADSSDMDSDAHVMTVQFDGSAVATQIGNANQYYYDYEPVSPILYVDKDNSGKLHVGLHNQSAQAKNAGATGEVRMRFKVEPVL